MDQKTSENVCPDYTYEELSNGFTCPTCQGTGRIPRGREDDLVALIPYNDARLKPRRTCLYVFLSIFVCAAVAGILLAFFLPRPMAFRQTGKVQTVSTWYNQSIPQMKLTLQTQFEVYNYNFVSTHGQSVTIVVRWSDQVIGTNVTRMNSTWGGREGTEFSGNVSVTLTENFLLLHCTDPRSTHLIYMEFTATLQYELMSQNQQSTELYYKPVDCQPVTAVASKLT